MLSKIKMLMGAAVVAIALPVNAATLTAFSDPGTYDGTRVVNTSTGAPAFIAGIVGESGSADWALDFQPDVDTQATTISSGFDSTITGVGLYESGYSEISGSWKLIGQTTAGGSFVATIVGTKDYFLRFVGRASTPGQTDGSSYNTSISAVPLPAAAWLFLSALAGYGLLGRRNNVQGAAIA